MLSSSGFLVTAQMNPQHRVAGVRRYLHTYANKRIRLTFELFAEEHVLDDDFLRFSSPEPGLPVVTVNYGEELLVNFDRSQRRSRLRCSLGDARLPGNDFFVESSVVDRPKVERLGFPRDTDLGCEWQTRFEARAVSKFAAAFRLFVPRDSAKTGRETAKGRRGGQTNCALLSRRQPPIADSLEQGFRTSPMRNAAEMRDTSRDADQRTHRFEPWSWHSSSKTLQSVNIESLLATANFARKLILPTIKWKIYGRFIPRIKMRYN